MKKEKNKIQSSQLVEQSSKICWTINFARLPELRDVESCDVAIVGTI